LERVSEERRKKRVLRGREIEVGRLAVTIEPPSGVVEDEVRRALEKEGWSYEAGHSSWFFGDTVLLFRR